MNQWISHEVKCPRCGAIELQRFEAGMKNAPITRLNCENCGNDFTIKSSIDVDIEYASVCSEYAREDGGTWRP